MTIQRRLKVMLWILSTRIKYNPFVNDMFGLALLCIGLLCLPFSHLKAAAYLTRSHRNTRKMKRQTFIERLLKKSNLLRKEIIDHLVATRATDEPLYAGRVFKLKEKHGQERGVLIMKFNDTFTRLRQTCDMEKLLADYFIALELSYYGSCNPQILQFLTYQDTRIVVGAVQALEHAFLSRLDGNIVPSNYSSSTWVYDKIFYPMDVPKEYDCIVVAMWSDIKRHYLLFEAIRRINDPEYRACLVGFPFGRTRADFEEMIDYYGIRHNVVIFDRIKQPELNELFNKSKVNLLLSSKEGGNKSIIEGFFAGVPGIVLSEHIGIDLDWINDKTGLLVERRKLAEALQFFRTNYKQYDPRPWAMDNLSCRASTAHLENTLKDISKELGLPWTRPLAVKVNRPECAYYDEKDALPPLDIDYYRKP